MQSGKYQGREICQGCKRPGSERWRWGKDQLCEDCKYYLNIGKDFAPEIDPDQYTYCFLTWYSIDILHNEQSKTLEFALRHLFQTLEHKSVNPTNRMDLMPSSATTAIETYRVKSDTAKQKKIFIDAFVAQQREFKEKIKNFQPMIEQKLNTERTKIYNEGIEKGRALLQQLNAGNITMKDFEQTLVYNKYEHHHE